MKRIAALMAAALCFLTLTACRARLVLSNLPDIEDIFGEKDSEETTESPASPTDPVPEDEDDGGELGTMAAYAWEVYEQANQKEREYESYDLFYSYELILDGSGMKAESVEVEMICRPDGDGEELLIKIREDREESLNYYKSGVGYFSDKKGKRWIPMDVDGFMEELGFTESKTLPKEAFTDAIVMENEDGTRTVSCPLSGKAAARYAEEEFGYEGTPQHLECGVTVNENGQPQLFFTNMTVSSYGTTVTMKSQNRYLAVGEDVTLVPPKDLDEYVGQWGMP